MLLTSGNDSIQIDPSKGGRVVSCVVSGLDLIVGEEPDALDWGCYPMVPWAGRVRNGHFAWGDVDVTLPIRMPPHAIHGTVFDRPWQESGAQELKCTLGDPWPWQATVRSQFSMEPECFHWEITVFSEDKPMPVVLGWHPWFRKRLADKSHATLHFSADEMYLRGADGIPSGAKSSPSKSPWDDCFTGVSVPPQIRWSNGLCLEVSSTCDYWVVYDEPDHALCVEPQSGPPDGFNQDHYAVVQPGSPLTHTMTWRWWRE